MESEMGRFARNALMMRGVIHSKLIKTCYMKKGLLLLVQLIGTCLLTATTLHAQFTDVINDMRSKTSGQWSAATTWEKYNGTT